METKIQKKNHMKAAGRARNNKITRLRKDDGGTTKDSREMGDMSVFPAFIYTGPGGLPSTTDAMF
jgi:hypothetical protein